MYPLGTPLPNTKHAVSVSLPKWEDVVGYEEKHERVISALQLGYPRFTYHPITEQLFQAAADAFAKQGEKAIIFPSEKVANQCVEYIGEGRVEPYKSVFAVLYPEKLQTKTHEFWQHAGLIISSRQSEDLLNDKTVTDDASKSVICKRVADSYNAAENDIFLFPSGMGAIFTAYKWVRQNSPDYKTVQLGFPYLDILKVQEKFGQGVYFLKYTSDSNPLDELVAAIENGVGAVFCELPGNPMLRTVDIPKLSKILRERNIPLVIDDTICTSYNVDITDYADIIATSLTKFFSGTGDALGGSLLVNPKSPFYQDIHSYLHANYEDLLYPTDAAVLEKNSRDYKERIEKINHNVIQLCEAIKGHESIKEIRHPYYVDKELYDLVKKEDGGYGGLFSIIFKKPEYAIKFYDNVNLEKGPSLGTNFTLVSPYTLLAHYYELDFAAENGIPADLVRVSVGLEKDNEIVSEFLRALDIATA